MTTTTAAIAAGNVAVPGQFPASQWLDSSDRHHHHLPHRLLCRSRPAVTAAAACILPAMYPDRWSPATGTPAPRPARLPTSVYPARDHVHSPRPRPLSSQPTQPFFQTGLVQLIWFGLVQLDLVRFRPFSSVLAAFSVIREPVH